MYPPLPHTVRKYIFLAKNPRVFPGFYTCFSRDGRESHWAFKEACVSKGRQRAIVCISRRNAAINGENPGKSWHSYAVKLAQTLFFVLGKFQLGKFSLWKWILWGRIQKIALRSPVTYSCLNLFTSFLVCCQLSPRGEWPTLFFNNIF